MRGAAFRRFQSIKQAQRFVTAHDAGYKLFRLGRRLVRTEYYLNLGTSAFSEWSAAEASNPVAGM